MGRGEGLGRQHRPRALLCECRPCTQPKPHGLNSSLRDDFSPAGRGMAAGVTWALPREGLGGAEGAGALVRLRACHRCRTPATHPQPRTLSHQTRRQRAQPPVDRLGFGWLRGGVGVRTLEHEGLCGGGIGRPLLLLDLHPASNHHPARSACAASGRFISAGTGAGYLPRGGGSPGGSSSSIIVDCIAAFLCLHPHPPLQVRNPALESKRAALRGGEGRTRTGGGRLLSAAHPRAAAVRPPPFDGLASRAPQAC